jgi:hypothetical protein
MMSRRVSRRWEVLYGARVMVMNESNPWYVAVGDSSVGPASTELVVRGIEHGKIPPDALVCEVGGSTWSSLATVEAFHAAVVRSYPPPPPDSEEAYFWSRQGFQFPLLGALPQFAEALDAEEVEAEAVEAEALDAEEVEAEAVEAEALDAEALDVPEKVESEPPFHGSDYTRDVDHDVDVDVDWGDAGDPGDARAGSAIDWSDPFESYFLVSDDVELPDEQAILESLSVVPRETFRHDGALWNLALCLAYGSDQVGAAAARAFFDTITEHGNVERLEWMSRTLLGNGFVPSGIPAEAGQLAFTRLRSLCPSSLQGTAA